MSNSLGIATVTACLQNILQNAFRSTNNIDDSIPDAQVTTLPPSATDGLPPTGANVFLFQVTPNAAGRNQDVPTRNSSGVLVARPRMALDLHYLITFYGDDTRFVPQRLLGIAARTLHRQPVLSPGLVTETINALLSSPLGLGVFANSNLPSADDPIRVTPTGLSADELARIWSVFTFRTNFSLSVAYQASLLFVDADDAGRTALPVTQPPNVYVDAGGPPVIDQVLPQPDPNGPVTPGSTVLLVGRGFGGAGARVVLDGQEMTPQPTGATNTQVSVTLPATLQAGTHGFQVARTRDMGTPPVPHQGLLSNVAPFVLPPQIGPGGITVNATAVNGDLVTGSFTVPVQPNLGERQVVVFYLNQLHTGSGPPPLSPQTYSFPVEAREPGDPANTITVPFRNVVAATYLARVQVDGAISALGTDANGKLVAPSVEVTGP